MANTQAAGFLPVRNTIAGTTIQYKRRRVLSNPTAGIGHGDAVITDANGNVLVATTANVAIASVSRGASYVLNGERVERHSLPASTTYAGSTNDPANSSYVYLVDEAATTIFESSVDEAIAITDLGLNYVMVLTAFNATTGYSLQELDATGRANTATFPWRVEEFVFRADSDPDLADAHVHCRINAGLIEPALTTTGL